MRDLTVTLVQANLAWQNPAQNRERFQQKLQALTETTDLIVLPEMFTTGFTMEASTLAETMDGPTIAWLKEQAFSKKCDIVGSLIVTEQERYFNRFVWVKPDGTLFYYDKRHLFRMAGEHRVYSAGDRLITVELHGWKIRPFVCYDLRFPVWSRNVNLAYDLAIYVANWPQRRTSAWRVLLQARAAENQSFVVGVNRVGTDGLGIDYPGASMAVDPVGNVIKVLSEKEEVVTVSLSYEQLKRFREKFPAWKDADQFSIVR